jgi:hypothetical protein
MLRSSGGYEGEHDLVGDAHARPRFDHHRNIWAQALGLGARPDHERAVGGVEISDQNVPAVDADLKMVTGDVLAGTGDLDDVGALAVYEMVRRRAPADEHGPVQIDLVSAGETEGAKDGTRY